MRLKGMVHTHDEGGKDEWSISRTTVMMRQSMEWHRRKRST